FNELGHMESNRKYASCIDHHVVANQVIRSALLERGERGENIDVIVHGVDVQDEFNPNNVDEKPLLSGALLPANKFFVSFIGRFSEEKCPEMFVEIANQLKGEQELHFVMLGNGPLYALIKKKIRSLGLERRFYTPGFVPDLRPFLKISGALVIPSRIEGIPIVLMESLALGVPVVASKVGGIPSVINPGFNGFLCESGEVTGFASSIKKLAGDSALRCRLQANSRKYAEQHVAVHHMEHSYLQIFKPLAATEDGRLQDDK